MTRLNVNCLPVVSCLLLFLGILSTVAAEDIFINPWQLRAPNLPYENLNATVGDSITFFWALEENHTVYINPTGNCDDTRSILLGNSSPVSYTFSESDAANTTIGNPVFFADNIAQLCEWGMRFYVEVFGQPSMSPIESPSTTPSQGPTELETSIPSSQPTGIVTAVPSSPPTENPTENPSSTPTTDFPTFSPTDFPSVTPTTRPTSSPTSTPTLSPSASPTFTPSRLPSATPTVSPSSAPSSAPTTSKPSTSPSDVPSPSPSANPTFMPTGPPVPFPTDPPTPGPTATPTTSPTSSPTTLPPTFTPSPPPTVLPTMQPTVPPTSNPTNESASGEQIFETITGLRIGIAGITELTPDAKEKWEEVTESFSTSHVFNDFKDSVSNFVTFYEVTNTSFYRPSNTRMLQGMLEGSFQTLRALQQEQQDVIIVEYTQTVKYNTLNAEKFTPELLVAAPFLTDEERSVYVMLLKSSSDPVLSQVKGVSEITVPSKPNPTSPPETPKDGGQEKTDPVLSKVAIIGIACGGAALLILIILFYMYCRKGGNNASENKSASDPPLQVDVRNDEVSTLAGPDGPPTYGDQSVATVDYDYSKAYGGAGDTSVSSAGGTFGSNAQNLSLPMNAAATGAALGTMDENSYDARYDSARAGAGNEEVIHIFAPPGKLGVVIDTPDDGAPVVHAVKDTSVIADRIIVGDKLVAVDDEDVRSMTAIKVSKMISRKGANPSRKLTIVRTVPIEE